MTKPKLVDRVDAAFSAIAQWSITYRRVVIIAAISLLAIGLYFASKARPDNSIEAYFDKSDPAYIAYMDYLEDFLSDEVSYIIYRAPQAPYGPFNIDIMRKVATLSEALRTEVPFVRDVTSLTDVEIIQAEGDFLSVDEMRVNFPENQAQLLSLRDSEFMQPLYIGYLVDANAEYAAIILDMERTSTDPLSKLIYKPEDGEGIANLYPQVSDAKIREILARPEYRDISFAISGDVAMNSAYNYLLGSDTSYILLATLALIVVLSLLLFRVTLLGMVGPISVVLLSVVLTVGVIGALGWDIGLFFAMIPTLLCAVGVAQSVHILLAYQQAYSHGLNRNQAVKAALTKVGGPCFMAALTTASGFLVMAVSELRGIQEMAVYSSIGVLLTFLLSITLLVVFLARDTKVDETSNHTAKPMAINPTVIAIVHKVIAINARHSRAIIIVSALLLTGALVGVSKLRIDFNFLTEFKPHVEFRQHTELAEKVMGGILNMTYIVDTHRPDGIKDKAVLQAIDAFQHFAEQHPLVKQSYSPVDVLKDLNKSFNGDQPSFYQLPTQQDLIAQYFLVYEVSGGEDLSNFVYPDFSRAVIELRVEMTDASKINALVHLLDTYLQDHPIPNASVRKTGIGLMWVRIAEYIGNTQLLSYSLVFAMVAVFMCISFGSIKVGLLSMIPNLTPVIVTLGLMGWFNVHLDYMKLLLATIAIGIAVDDTIHLVTRYRNHFLRLGNYRQALDAALLDVGPALIITSLILVGSFSSYYFSNTTILASFGGLLSGAITMALLADLFLMPVLILALKPFGPEFTPSPQH